ncbi:biosynthetic arginine decarboxylase [Synechocystis sp. LKSZ1]|uniref:biosynthetic arginine decarboxylase n=1 Tax=Synechocystis sp. LKSZ1 TaxID=3144951 RepID=UPI00336BFD45
MGLESLLDEKKEGKKLKKLAANWSIEESENLYRISGWGDPYFAINAAGHITVSPHGDRGGSLDLLELVESLRKRKLGMPLLIRFSDILADRLERLNSCFAKAIARYKYPGTYQGVYPIKCNQQRHLVEALVNYGKPYQFGLEAGSKPELMIALATLPPQLDRNEKASRSLIICNGYKDREYLETALLAKRLGHRAIIVIDQPRELDWILHISQQLGIKPLLGIRAKLSTKGEGQDRTAVGDRAKFGLTVPEILAVVNRLEAVDRLDCLKLLHFHVGSQISNITVIKEAMREASQIYVQLAKLGAKMRYLNVGGGLAVDYDGSNTNFPASKNYNMQNYANDIVAAIQEACEQANVNAPTLISESGRAIAAHQSVLVFDVLGTNHIRHTPPEALGKKDHTIVQNLWEAYQGINPSNYQEAYHDAVQLKEEAISLFNFGYLSLTERAKVEQLYWACCRKILNITRNQDFVPEDVQDLEKLMASIYYVNLSVFQSAPESWSLNQLFPIMPIHRLNEEPRQRAILADLTCDSDGKIDRFIDLRDVKSCLELHDFRIPETHAKTPKTEEIEPYYLGMFLVGAYQEIMGNLHNLFGDINVVHIAMTPHGYQIESVVKGDTMNEVLSYVQYDAEDLLERMRRYSEKALADDHITLEESQRLLQDYEQSLRRYTYLVDDGL